jgi:hypothetical protein
MALDLGVGRAGLAKALAIAERLLPRCDRQSSHGGLRNARALFAACIAETNKLWRLILWDALPDQLIIGSGDHICIFDCCLLTLLRSV